MAITINGTGTITGINAGGLPDGTVDNGSMADDAIDSAEIADGAIDLAHLSASGTKNSSTFLRGDNTWESAGGGAGTQVGWKHMSDNTALSVSSNDTWYDTGLSITYTPASSNSLIFLDARLLMFLRPNGHSTCKAILRFELDDSGNDLGEKFHVTGGSSWNGSYGYNVGIIYWPTTYTYVYTNSNTTQKVFKLQIQKNSSSYLDINPDNWFTSAGKSWFILSEIQQ